MLPLSPAAPRRHESLTIHPLLSPEDTELGYDLLPDALAADTLRITEVGSGTVPELLAINEADRDVLVLDGEQLIGAKQNRMASRSIVLPARSTTKIPVTCMEQGRWHARGERFAPSEHHSPSRVRKKNREREAAYAARGARVELHALREAQGEVWDEIDKHLGDLGASSSTHALDEGARRRGADLAAWIARFPVLPGQVGILAFLGAEPLGLDVLGDRRLWAWAHERITGGYVQDALARRDAKDEPDPEAAHGFLAGVRRATRTESASVGLGTYRVLSDRVTGGELEVDGRTVHVSAFPLDPGSVRHDEVERPLPPPSRRRRWIR